MFEPCGQLEMSLILEINKVIHRVQLVARRFVSENLGQVSDPKHVNTFFFCFKAIIVGLAFAGLSCLESGGINADCMPQHFLSVLFFIFISFYK